MNDGEKSPLPRGGGETSALVPSRTTTARQTPVSYDVILAGLEAADQRRRYLGIPLTVAVTLLGLFWVTDGAGFDLPAGVLGAVHAVYFVGYMTAMWHTRNRLPKELVALGVDKPEAKRLNHLNNGIVYREARRLRSPEDRAQYLWRAYTGRERDEGEES